MTKKLIICFLALGLSMQLAGCSSNDSKEDVDVAEANDDAFSEESDGDFADEGDGESTEVSEAGDEFSEEGDLGAEGTDGTETADAGGEGTDGSDPLAEGVDLGAELDDESAQAANSEKPTDTTADAGADGGTGTPAEPADDFSGELALGEDDSLPSDSLPDEPAPQVAAEPAPYEEPTVEATPESNEQFAGGATDESIYSDPGASSGTDVAQTYEQSSNDSSSVADTPSFIPVKKIRESAFAANDGTNLNRVYLGRSGDTVKSVSEKIYGKDRSRDLLSWNGHLRRGLKTGDKVYYSSPNNPGDTAMKTFYDDAGVPPSTYVSREGDNIRAVSKELLGSSESWKEVWATNMDIESKGDIPSGLQIQYWPESATSMTASSGTSPNPIDESIQEPIAASPTDSPPPIDAPPPGMPQDDFQVAESTPPTPPQDFSMEQPPAPPQDFNMDDPTAGDDGSAVGSVAPPPPPPSDPKPVAKKSPAAEMVSSEDDMTMMLGFGGILFLAVAVIYVVVRKNRARHADLGHTQV